MIVWSEWAKETVNGMQQNAAHSGTACRIALNDSQVVVDIDVELGQDPSWSAKVSQCRIRARREGNWDHGRRWLY
jgi:hypothetical protein